MLAYLLTYMIVMIDMVEDYGFTQARTLTDTSAACRLRLSLLIMACELLQQIVLSMSSHSSHCQKTSRISKHDGPVKLCCLTDTEIGELARPSAFGKKE